MGGDASVLGANCSSGGVEGTHETECKLWRGLDELRCGIWMRDGATHSDFSMAYALLTLTLLRLLLLATPFILVNGDKTKYCKICPSHTLCKFQVSNSIHIFMPFFFVISCIQVSNNFNLFKNLN